MKEAFYYMFKDNKIIQKSLIMVSFLLIPMIVVTCVKIEILQLIFLILLLPAIIILSGYWINCVKAIADQKNNIILPYINIKNNIITGFKWIIAGLILGLIVSVVMLFCFGLGVILPFLGISIFAILFIALYILSTAFAWIFAKTNNIYSYIHISEAIEYINKDKKRYFIAVILLFVINLLWNIIVKYVPDNFIFVVLITCIAPYVMFVTAYINAMAINTESLPENSK